MAAPLTIGDKVWFDGAFGTVVATTNTTSTAGGGSVDHGERTYRFAAVRASGPDVPFVATDDEWFRVGLLEHPGGDKWALVFDDPHEGRLLRARRYQEQTDAWLPDLQDWQQLFVTCWETRARVLKGGVAQTGVYVGLEVLYSTSEGQHLAWALSPYPNRNDGTVANTIRGSYGTDVNGYVKHLLPDGTLERLLFPRGHGAWGQREQDRMWSGPEAPVPERKLTTVRLVYAATPSPPVPGDNLAIPEFVELTEGTEAQLDCRSAQLTINGPAAAGYRAQLEGSGVYRAGSLDAGGTATLTGMLPGTWHVRIGAAYSTTTEWPGRQTVDVPAGGSATVSFGASSALPAPPNHVLKGYTYRYGAEPSDATLHILYQCPGQPNVEETTSAGSYSVPFRKQINGWWYTAKEVWVYDGEGYWGEDVSSYTATGIFFNMAVGGKVALHAKAWGPWGDRLHAMPPRVIAHVSHTGDPGGVFTDLVRHADTGLYLSEDPTFSHKGPSTAGNYTVYAEDGTLLANGTSGNDPLPSSAGGDDLGIAPSISVGGRIHGNVVAATQDKIEVETPLLEDAARLGAERGKLVWGVEWRHYSPTLEERVPDDPALEGQRAGRVLAFAAMECPFCGGEVWRLPDLGGYTRGYCTQCAYEGRGQCEARSFLASVTLPSFADWRCWVTQIATAGGVSQQDLWSHWRPEDYREVDSYLAAKAWLGPNGFGRWVAKHFTFAEVNKGGVLFTDGTSIAAQEAAQGRTIGPCRLKAVPGGGVWTSPPARFRVTCTRPDGGSDTVDLTIPTGFGGSGDLFPDFVRLSTKEQLDSDRGFGPHAGFYTDVTGVTPLDDPPASVRFDIVNDSPHRNNGSGVPVRECQAEPYLVLLPLVREGAPYLCRDAAGRIHRFLRRGGAIVHEVLASRTVGWEGGEMAFDPNHVADTPCGALLPDGTLLCTCQWSGGTVLRRSRDDGATWETVSTSSP